MSSCWNNHFYYDESSPSCIRWASSLYSGRYSGTELVQAGSVAGTLGNSYWRVQVDGKVYSAHRVVWELHNGPIAEGLEIDHINGDITDNRLSNLRLVTKSVNCRNRRLRADSTSRLSGVARRERILPSGSLYASWQGRVVDARGTRLNKEFSISKYGEDAARQLAIDFVHRIRNNPEHMYTERHGTI